MTETNMLKLVLRWSGLGEEGTISWHFKGNMASHSSAQLHDAAGNVVTRWGTDATPSSLTTFRSLIANTQVVNDVTLYEYAVDNGPATAQGIGPIGIAGSGSQVAPLQCALVATSVTALAGARHRGRQYFPAHCLTVQSANALLSDSDTSKVGDLASGMGATAAAGIAESLAIADLVWAVYSRTNRSMEQIVSTRTDNKVDTQRRREASLRPTIFHASTV